MSSETEDVIEFIGYEEIGGEETSSEDIEDKTIPEECRICFLTYTSNGPQKPKTLPCCHTFCTVCLVNTISDGILTCPTCQFRHKFPLEAPGSIPEGTRVSDRKGIISRRQSELHFAQVKMEEEFRACENRVDELMKLNRIVSKKLQESKFDKNDENDYLCLLLLDEKSFMNEVQESMEKVRERFKGVVTKLSLAETEGEMFLLMAEAAIYHKGLARWEALFKGRQPKVTEIFARANELLKRHSKALKKQCEERGIVD